MIHIGIVGAGIRGKLFAEAALNNSLCQLVGICDINPAALQEIKTKYDIAAFTNLHDLLALENLDVLCVTTPDFLHRDIIIAAAERGLHIFVEKPLATTMEDCLAIKNAIEKAGTKLTVAFTNRWNPPFIRAKEAIERGDIGDIITLNSRLNDTIYVPEKMLKWSKQTSPAWFLMSHTLDLALWFTGKKVKSVYATGIKKVLVSKGIDTFDFIHAIVNFEDGTDAIFEAGWILPETMPKIVDYKYEIIGSQGAIFVDTHDQMIHLSTPIKYEHPDTFLVNAHGRLFGHNLVCFDSFVDAINSGQDPVVNIDEAIENTHIINAIHDSINKNMIIQL